MQTYKKATLLLGFFFAISTSLYPCGNEYGYALNGQRIWTRYFYLSEAMKKFDLPQINARLKELGQKVKDGTADYKTWSDIAANLMKVGKADSAVKILKPLSIQYPNEYNIAANLGTSYELVGKIDSALKYISKGLALNPKSHFGSEWIHVKLLEAMVKEKKHPGWIGSHPIISMQELSAKVDTSHLMQSVHQVNEHFFYQIRTRAPFTPAPDPIIANLLITLGDFNVKHGTYENALLTYTYALEYEGSDYRDRAIADKIRELNKKRDQQKEITELPEMFVRMMKMSRIDPQVLLMGLGEFAGKLDSLDKEQWTKQDSLDLLKQRLDALEKKKAEKPAVVAMDETSGWENSLIFAAGGLVLGVLLTYIVLRRRNKK